MKSPEIQNVLEAKVGQPIKTPENISSTKALENLESSISIEESNFSENNEKSIDRVKNYPGVEESDIENTQNINKEASLGLEEAKNKAILEISKLNGENVENKEGLNNLKQKEEEYLTKKMIKVFNKKKNEWEDPFAGLDKRYEDEKSGVQSIQKQIDEYTSKSGLKHEAIPELENKTFNLETKKIISEKIKSNLDALLLNKEKARHNPEKHETMLKQSERYLDLLEQAQIEGDISKEVGAEEILKLMERNVDMITFQDMVASENMLGDHGIRHVVAYNIKMIEQMLDSVSEKGQEVKAIDRIMGHQIMLMHDLGYATEPVREGVNKGDFSADKGHNLLSAKILREMGENPDDALSKVFSNEQMDTLHQGILEHDDSKVEFHINDNNPEARKENLLSAIHLADNTHAFEDKLPELLYSVPESLKAMRLLKTAGEIGDKDMIENVKKQLILDIENNSNYSKDDQKQLSRAVDNLAESSYKFAIGRICGNKPEVSIGEDGRVTIKVQESAIHQEAVGLFGQDSYDQLKKFISDLEGVEKNEITNEMLNQERIEGKNVTMELALGDKKSIEKTDYQQRIEGIVKDEKFVEFSRQDLILSRRQKSIENRIKDLNGNEIKNDEEKGKLDRMNQDVDKYKIRRREIYNEYEK